jgi:hypothetical protein
LIERAFSTVAGEAAGMLDFVTGCVSIHFRMTSYRKERGASVLMEPESVCEREAWKPAFRSAFLLEIS